MLYVDVAEVVVETDGHDSYVDGENYAVLGRCPLTAESSGGA
ncbi:MAG TPA: hypothetical protein VIP75_00205 [Acidothermales bacterium]|nr:hypothetical protein [Actinomycetes bacterium]